MPKLKTRRSIAKRFRWTATGKIRRTKAGRRHLLTGKSRNQKRRLRRPDLVSPVEEKLVKRLLPYG